jgi:hypothetical protein
MENGTSGPSIKGDRMSESDTTPAHVRAAIRQRFPYEPARLSDVGDRYFVETSEGTVLMGPYFTLRELYLDLGGV